MAPLNPTIQPTNDPNFRGYSQAIQVPDTIKPQGVGQNEILPKGVQQGDTSAEYQGRAAAYGMQAEGADLQAYGDLFKNIVNVADFAAKGGVAIVKKDIEDKVYDIADRERQQYTRTLEQIKAAGGVNSILAPPGTDASGEAPQEIQDLGDNLATLKTSKDNGKISSSYYEGRLLAEAKKLRAQYPGFREEIDAQFAKVTGSNPANAYVRALTSDINKMAAAGSSEVKKAENYILQRTGYPGAQDMLEKVQTGRATLGDVVAWSAPYEQQDTELKRRAAVFNDNNLSRQDKQVKVGALFDDAAGIAVSRAAEQMANRMGIPTGEAALRMDNMIKNGNNPIPQQQWIQWGQETAQIKSALSIQMSRDADRTGATAILGKDEVNKRIAAALKPLDDLGERIYNKDMGGYYQLTQELKGINDVAQKGLLTNPKLGPRLQVMQALKNIGGEQNLQKLSLDIIKGDYSEDLKTYMSGWTKNFATQYNMKSSGVPVTFNDAIDDIKQKGLSDKRLNAAMLNEVNKITDGTLSDEIRLNYARAAFSPENRGMISKLNADGVDKMGRPVSGQNAIFQKFTSPEMTKSMFALGEKDPQAWKNYTDWARETFSSELLNQDINKIAQIRNPHVRVGWDSDNQRFVPRYDTTPSKSELALGNFARTNPNSDPEYNIVERAVNRINSGLDNYKNIAKASGANVEQFLIKAIADTNPDAVQHTDQIPYQIIRDLGLSQMKGIGRK